VISCAGHVVLWFANGIFACHYLATFRYLAGYRLDCVFWLFNESQQVGEA